MPSKPKRPHPLMPRGGSESTAQKRLTSERILEDLADFKRAGGRVEVLGTTRVLKKLEAPDGGDSKA